MTVDPVTLQVIQARLAGIVQEMQNSLFRTGYSTIIRESQDASCAILNRQGEVVAQHVAGAIDALEQLLVGHALFAAFDGDLRAAPLVDVAIHEPRCGVERVGQPQHGDIVS